MKKEIITWLFSIAAVFLLLAVLWPEQSGSPEEREALRQGRTVLIFWDRHSGHEYEAREKLIEEYNHTQGIKDKIYVRSVPIGYNALMEKILTSISGGCPPDICVLDAAFLAQLAARGCFQPMENFMEQHPAMRKEAYFPAVYNMVCQNGHAYGIPVCTDTYCLLWNKSIFRQAGLDPERPPKTIKELEDYAAKLTVYNEQGDLKQIGFLPWLPWDHTGMWGGLFGGTWYDPQKGRVVCAEDPAILRSLQWQQRWAINPHDPQHAPPFAIDPKRFMSFSKSFGAYQSANNMFYSGKVAMIVEGEWQCTFIPKYAPELDWGVTPIPQPSDAKELIAWTSSCITDCIPVSAKHPREALKFLAWFHSPRAPGKYSPVSDFCMAIHNIPARKEEAMQKRFIEDPKFSVFVHVMMNRKTRCVPMMPESQFFNDTVERIREFVTFWEMTPEEALRKIEDSVNSRLEKTRRFMNRINAGRTAHD